MGNSLSLVCCVLSAVLLSGNIGLASEPFDLADAAFLYPLPAPGLDEMTVNLRLSDAGALGPVLSQKNFAKLSDYVANVGMSAEAGYRATYITSVHLDPCVPKVSPDADPKKCAISLMRLVAQTVKERDGVYEAADAAIHLIYAFKLDDKVVAEMRALKTMAGDLGFATTGESLGIHPVFRGDNWQEQSGQDFAKTVKTFLLKRVGESAQVAASLMVTKVVDEEIIWEWSKVVFNPMTHQVVSPKEPGYEELRASAKIANVEGDTFVHQFVAQRGTREGKIVPKSKVVPGVERLLTGEPRGGEDDGEAYDHAYHIENPRHVTIPEADCASCHVATSRRLFAEKSQGKKLSEMEFVPVDGIQSAMDPEIEAGMRKSAYRVINFGYVFLTPSISQRTVNETVEAVRFLNANF